jgi:signal peptidase I
MRRLSRVQNNLLTLGAVLGALCLLAAIVAVLVGAKPLVFRSGSMAPAIPTGALGLSIPVEAKALRAGDIISVETAAGVRITHRVVQADVSGDTATVTLKGDANSIPDAETYVLRKTERVVAHAPLLGYAVAWLSSSAAVFAGGLFTAYLLYLAFGAPGRRRSQPEAAQPEATDGERLLDEDRPAGGHRAQRRARRARRLTAMSLASLGVLTGGALHTAAPSQAAFADSAPGTAQFTATTVAKPILECGNSGSYNVTFTLTHPGDFATLYELRTLAPADKLWAGTVWQPGTPVSVTIDADDSAFTFTQATDIEFRASSKIGAWASAPALKNVRYTPATGIPFVDLIPASLRCVT